MLEAISPKSALVLVQVDRALVARIIAERRRRGIGEAFAIVPTLSATLAPGGAA